MIVTTSRDPSAGTRRFARTLASFLSLPYVNRGKSSVGEGEPGEAALVVVEDHGNPSGIIKRASGREERLYFRLSGQLAAGRMKKRAATVCGERGIARPVASFFELQWLGESAPDPATRPAGRQTQDEGLPRAKESAAAIAVPSRNIIVAPGCIDFIDEGAVRFRLKI